MAESHANHESTSTADSRQRRVGLIKTIIVGAVIGTGAGFGANFFHHVPLDQNVIAADSNKVSQAGAESTDAAGEFFSNLQALSQACRNTVATDLNGLDSNLVVEQAATHKSNSVDKSCAKDDINNIIVADAYAQQYRSSQERENSAAITLKHDEDARHWVYNYHEALFRPEVGLAVGVGTGLVLGGAWYAGRRRKDLA